MRYPKLRELKEAIKALIKGPYTSRFPYKPHRPYERFRGKPEFYEEDCMGCGACFQVCPAKAIEMQDIKDKRILTVRWDMCVFCGQCEVNCPTEKGIMLSGDFDLATTGKREELRQTIEKQLILCECCGEIVAPLDQIIWVAKKIGPLCFSNPSLMLFYLRNFPAVAGSRLSSNGRREDLALKKEYPKEDLEFMRSDRIKVLCPRCRREAVVKS